MSDKPALVDVETFLVVADELSISGAARSLDVSKSVVSRRLQRIESTLKVQLLRRTTRRVELTEEGQIYFNGLRSLRGLLDKAHEELQRTRDRPSGLIRMILPSYLGSSVVTQKVIPEFLSDHPDVVIDARLTDAGPFTVPREFDLFLMTRLIDRTLPDSTMRERKLGRLRSGVFATPSYLERMGTPTHPNDLAAHQCVSYRGRQWRFKPKDKNSYLVDVSGPVITGSNEILRSAVLAHRGLTYSFPAVFEEQLASGQVVEVLEDWTEDAGLDLRMLTPGLSYPPLRIQLFADAIVKELGMNRG